MQMCLSSWYACYEYLMCLFDVYVDFMFYATTHQCTMLMLRFSQRFRQLSNLSTCIGKEQQGIYDTYRLCYSYIDVEKISIFNGEQGEA